MAPPLEQVFYGQMGGPNLYQANTGYTDGGQPIAVRFLTAPFSPAGEAGEALFRSVTLTVSGTMACTLRVTPSVDGVAVPGAQYLLGVAGAPTWTTQTFEMGLARQVTDPVDPSVVLATLGVRGNALSLLIEVLAGSPAVPGLAAGELLLESPSLVFQKVRGRRAAATPVPA